MSCTPSPARCLELILEPCTTVASTQPVSATAALRGDRTAADALLAASRPTLCAIARNTRQHGRHTEQAAAVLEAWWISLSANPTDTAYRNYGRTIDRLRKTAAPQHIKTDQLTDNDQPPIDVATDATADTAIANVSLTDVVATMPPRLQRVGIRIAAGSTLKAALAAEGLQHNQWTRWTTRWVASSAAAAALYSYPLAS